MRRSGPARPPDGADRARVDGLVLFEQDLRAKAHHQHLTFRVAEADVVFHQPGAIILDHQARIEHALKRGAAPGHFGPPALPRWHRFREKKIDFRPLT